MNNVTIIVSKQYCRTRKPSVSETYYTYSLPEHVLYPKYYIFEPVSIFRLRPIITHHNNCHSSRHNIVERICHTQSYIFDQLYYIIINVNDCHISYYQYSVTINFIFNVYDI